jgi:hypothetical protein
MVESTQRENLMSEKFIPENFEFDDPPNFPGRYTNVVLPCSFQPLNVSDFITLLSLRSFIVFIISAAMLLFMVMFGVDSLSFCDIFKLCLVAKESLRFRVGHLGVMRRVGAAPPCKDLIVTLVLTPDESSSFIL